MKTLQIFLALIVILPALGLAQVNPRDMNFPAIEFNPAEPERFVTDNGMVIYFLEDHQLPVVTLDAYFKGGTIYDPADKTGLTGIMAALLRSGGAGKRTPDQADQDLDFVGARISSQAADHALILELNILKKDIDLGLTLLADMLLKPKFDSARLALELSNAMDNVRRQNDDPHGISRRVFYQTVYGNHPYGQFATLESLGKIARADIMAQSGRFYHPDNCILAVAGDLTYKELQDLIKKYFGAWPKGMKPLETVGNARAGFKPGVYYAEKDINQANMRLGYLCMTDDNPDRLAMEVMNYALGGGGFSSRITGQVRTSAGLAYSVGTYNYLRPLMGPFFGYCQTKAESMSQALQMILDIIEEVKQKGITAEELDLAKDALINGYVFNYDTPAKLVNAKAMLELRGFPSDQLEKDLITLQALTLEKCNEVAKFYLDTKNIAIVVVGDEKLFDKPLTTFGPVTKVSMEIK